MHLRPIIGLSADLKTIEPHPYHCVGDKYVRAVAEAAGGVPVLLPALRDSATAAEVLDVLDGLVLTGSYANVHPQHYGGGEPADPMKLDPARDAANLSLIPAAIERGLPLLGICRGFQEMNVALGGTLHQRVHETEPYDNHLEDASQPLDVQYGPAHALVPVPGGLLERLAAGQRVMVNSLHGQGIDRLAGRARIEARAPDGLVEAFAVDGARGFALAVQWHPEWKPNENAFYAAIWREFAAACDRFRRLRQAASGRVA